MKTVVHAMFNALPGVGNVAAVSLLFMLIFSILGVQLFGGRFGRCTVAVGAASASRTACEAAGHVWYNFG